MRMKWRTSLHPSVNMTLGFQVVLDGGQKLLMSVGNCLLVNSMLAFSPA